MSTFHAAWPRAITAVAGVAAYALALACMGYLVGFTANLGVPRGVDGGSPVPWGAAVDLALLALFGLQHSVMARRPVKAWLARACPPALERSLYLGATCAVLGLLFLLWRPMPEPVLWRLESPAAVAAAWAVFCGGWALAAWSTFWLDHAELFGLRQALGWPRPPASAALRTPGLYRWVRHPLYLGMLVGLWATPVMTAGHALLASGMSAYVAMSMALEERDLLAAFGDAYRQYRQRAGPLWPRWARRARARDASR